MTNSEIKKPIANSQMQLEIITPETTLFKSNEVQLVQLPGKDGSFEVMDQHAPLISILKKGRIKVVGKDASPQFYDIQGGVIEILRNHVLILAE